MKINFKKSMRVLTVLLLALCLFTITSCKKDEPKPTPNPNKPDYDLTDLTVRDYVGKNGVVAAANPYAAEAGIQVLKQGGNAFDAAVAVSFALGVVEPHASGVAGGGIMVAYDAAKGGYVSYNFREFVPGLGTEDQYPNGDRDVDDGIKASGVPTQVAGLVKIQEEQGNLSLPEVMAPAINYARNGFPVTPGLAQVISDNFNKVMENYEEVGMVFSEDGIDPIAPGKLLIQTDYANVLQRISDEGLDGFYSGPTAEAILAASGTAAGGLITQEDLNYARNNYPIHETPVTSNYRGYDIASANIPSSGGIILIEALNMLENLPDLKGMGHNTAEYINAIGTAMALAYGDKRKYIADNKISPTEHGHNGANKPFNSVPVSVLTSKDYATDRWNDCYKPNQAFMGRFGDGTSDYGNPWDPKYGALEAEMPGMYDDSYDYIEHYSTTAFSVADKEGNIVSVTQTINHFFGNAIVPHGTGFFMNNQLSSFSFSGGSVHYIAPYKQPVSHIMPTIIMKDANPWATLGSPGGLRIPSAVLQVVLNLIEFDMSIQEAIAAPRVYTYAASSSDLSTTSKYIQVENAISQEAVDGLTAMNYYVGRTGAGDIDLYFGGVQGIRFNFEAGTMHGGADPRRDGKAIGY